MQKLFLDTSIEKIEKKDKIEETKNKNFTTTHFIVSKENKKTLRKEVGDYFVLQFSYERTITHQSVLEKEVERILKSFFKKYPAKKILIIGLGNKDVLSDALGVKVTDKLIATNHYQDFLTIPKIALFNPSVTDKTGISSFSLIKMVVEEIHPEVIIMIDSLATAKETYLNSAIEINDTGIIPGSALNSAREINKKTFGIPILSIGVPTCLEYKKKLYTSTYINEVIESTSTIVANVLNHLFL